MARNVLSEINPCTKLKGLTPKLFYSISRFTMEIWEPNAESLRVHREYESQTLINKFPTFRSPTRLQFPKPIHPLFASRQFFPSFCPANAHSIIKLRLVCRGSPKYILIARGQREFSPGIMHLRNRVSFRKHYRVARLKQIQRVFA